MRVILFGATGMIGQGVLRECLLDPRVERVLSIGRSETGQRHAKLRELQQRDLLDLSAIEPEFAGYDACFYCLGVSSAGMAEADYRRVTYDMPLAAAHAILRHSPDLTFVHVSGGGADSSGKGRLMWARVKGEAENALLALPFAAVYIIRPGFVQPLHGIRSKTPIYNVLYRVFGPLYPMMKLIVPKYVTTTEQIGRAMLRLVENGYAKRVLENDDINRV